MSISPESIEVGKCYLAFGSRPGSKGYLRVRRVTEILLDGRVRFDQRRGPVVPGRLWPGRYTMKLEAFARSVGREAPCDWTSDTEEGAG